MTSTTRRAMVIAPLACALAPLMTPLVHATAGMEVGGVQFAALFTTSGQLLATATSDLSASMSAPPGDVPVQSTIDLSYCTGK